MKNAFIGSGCVDMSTWFLYNDFQCLVSNTCPFAIEERSSSGQTRIVNSYWNALSYWSFVMSVFSGLCFNKTRLGCNRIVRALHFLGQYVIPKQTLNNGVLATFCQLFGNSLTSRTIISNKVCSTIVVWIHVRCVQWIVLFTCRQRGWVGWCSFRDF